MLIPVSPTEDIDTTTIVHVLQQNVNDNHSLHLTTSIPGHYAGEDMPVFNYAYTIYCHNVYGCDSLRDTLRRICRGQWETSISEWHGAIRTSENIKKVNAREEKIR